MQDQQHTQQPQEDYLTASLKQQLLQDVSSFFQAEIAPRSLSISEVTALSCLYVLSRITDCMCFAAVPCWLDGRSAPACAHC
jgi:hypothetical protein